MPMFEEDDLVEEAPRPHRSLQTLQLNGNGNEDKPSIFGRCLKRLDSLGFRCAVLGVNVLILLSFVPVWNAAVMIQDPVFEYIFGLWIPKMIIAVMCAVVVAWIVEWVFIALFTAKGLQNELNFLMITTVFISALGVACLLMSFPVLKASDSLADSVYGQECQFRHETSDIYQAYQDLSVVRSKPLCLEQTSVETCAGYIPSKEADVLRKMEKIYKCSGWCSTRSDNSARVPGAESYPPSLFSKSNDKVSCDGMAARHLQDFLQDVSYELYYEGVYLLSVAILVGFLQMFQLSFQEHALMPKKDRAAEYGALSAFTAAEPEPAERRRYVSQGVLY